MMQVDRVTDRDVMVASLRAIAAILPIYTSEAGDRPRTAADAAVLMEVILAADRIARAALRVTGEGE